jgi:hypothetical protein
MGEEIFVFFWPRQEAPRSPRLSNLEGTLSSESGTSSPKME